MTPALQALGVAAACAAAPAIAQQSGATWDWQLQEPLDLAINVDVLDLDPDAVSADQIAALRARGVLTICYVSVGTVENWRADRADFPAAIVGAAYDGWPGERFLDIRRRDILLPLMQARFRRCADLGFDAIEPDNMDVQDNTSGFDIGPADTVAYVQDLARLAHAMGLRIGQKNLPDLTQVLEPHLDFIITEGCMSDGWCDAVAAYAAAGKAVLAAEYGVAAEDRPAFCAAAQAGGISMIFKDLDLTAGGASCG